MAPGRQRPALDPLALPRRWLGEGLERDAGLLGLLAERLKLLWRGLGQVDAEAQAELLAANRHVAGQAKRAVSARPDAATHAARAAPAAGAVIALDLGVPGH